MSIQPGVVNAQGFMASIKMGVSATSISGDTDTNFDPRAGLAGGAGVGYDFGNGLSVQGDVLYLTKGAYADTEEQTIIIDENGQERINAVPVRARFDLIYLDMPLLLVYRFHRRDLRPKLFAGPMLSYNANSQVAVRAVGSDFTQTNSDDSIVTYDFGAVAGIGLEKEISGEWLSFEVRGIFGQSNIRETNPALKNNGIVFLLGFQF